MYPWNHDIEPYKHLPTLTTMPASCKKVKNPCKICLAHVTHKSGIQCEGACRSWVHYKCLNFTPGKISDIKRGLIIVSCPCPDCTTNMPKEIVKDEPFSCTNAYCPANIPPKCMNAQCPSNAALPPPGHNNLLAKPQQRPMPHFGPCTIDNCKSTKVSPTHRSLFRGIKDKIVSPCVSCCSGGDIKKTECVTQTKPQRPPPPPPCPPMPCQPPQQYLPPPFPPPQCLPLQCPPPQCPPSQCTPPPCPPPPCPPPQCPPPKRPQPRAQSPKCRYNSNQAAKKNTAAIKAMERMCNTMGQLTRQLNTLMDKMQIAMTIPQCPPPCPSSQTTCVMPSTQTNSCSVSELPCCCPGGSQQGGINDQQSMNSCPSMPASCLQDQNNYDTQTPCYCPSNPLRRNDFY